MNVRSVLMVMGLAAAAAAQPQAPSSMGPGPTGNSVGSSASVTLKSGPHKGKYDFSPKEACILTSFSDKPLGLSVVMNAQDSSLSIDVPNLDEKHAHELQMVLVIADSRPGAARRSSVTYEIDTRPDAVLEPFQKAERANKGMTGKATATLMTQGANTLLSFSGETMQGVKVDGEVTCRRVVQ